MRFSHLRDLVTIIEMQEAKTGTAPLSKVQSCVLRKAFKTALREFAEKEPNSDKWYKTMEKRIDLINYHDAKIGLANFIAKLPKGFVSVPEEFARCNRNAKRARSRCQPPHEQRLK